MYISCQKETLKVNVSARVGRAGAGTTGMGDSTRGHGTNSGRALRLCPEVQEILKKKCGKRT